MRDQSSEPDTAAVSRADHAGRGRAIMEHERTLREKSAAGGNPPGNTGAGARLLSSSGGRGGFDSLHSTETRTLAADARAAGDFLFGDEHSLRDGHDSHDGSSGRVLAVHQYRLGIPVQRFIPRRALGRANLFALAMAMAGVWWIVQADWATQYYYGNLLALGSGIGYAGVIVSLRLLRGENAAWLVALCHTAAGLILLPSVLTSELRLEPLQWGLVVIFGIVQMGIPYVILRGPSVWCRLKRRHCLP